MLSSALSSAAARVIDAGKTPGLQYAVVQAGAITASGSAGTANISASTPVTNETRFHIGSVTKLFTAVSIMQLVETGALRLDDSLAHFEPSFPDASEITVRELLMHRSGIPDYADAALASGAVKTPTTPQAIVDSIAAKPLLSTPGTAFAYSNTNYVLL
ncbi:MAG: beta-lactamase family protein, partial [Candidatus Eremiobacteraeota bacterium]|nr:beta-lactamase family protein [Candidatus Eremiobacteraeota bacterium]